MTTNTANRLANLWDATKTASMTEAEKLLLERAIRLHPDDAELKKRASADDFPSRFRK